ncbi:MAG TPA: VanW family protein [Anaerolineales bacterium]|nr:VanW family protein [Anaerolineales bacterium]
MNTPIYTQPTPTGYVYNRPSSLGQALAALVLGLALFLFLVLLVPVVYGMSYAGRIFQGVSVNGVDVSGLTTQEAADHLSQSISYPFTGRVVFQDGAKIWVASPNDLGMFLDAQTSALAAYNVGRAGGALQRLGDRVRTWTSGVDLAPVFIFDERAAEIYLKGIAAEVDRSIIEASLGVSGVDVVVRSGQIGRTMDVPAALDALSLQLPTMTDGIIPLVVVETAPIILDVSAQAELARNILSAPLVLQVPSATASDPGPWTFEPDALAAMLAIERVNVNGLEQYQVGISSQALRTFLEGIAPSLVQYPENARFIFNDETRQLDLLQGASIGRSLDVETTITLINQKLAEGVHTLELDMEYTNPAVTDDATAEQLGIGEAVSVYTSYFYGSSAERIQNISIASARFHGLLVAPGQTFSMASTLGDVSLDTGYTEALIIYGDRTIQGVGGGVCQVSTTLFRTVFFGGYQIDQRYAHAYRVSYYEMNANGSINPNLAGLDATVFAPVVDFKFTNDTPYWLLMETYVDASARTLTWKFYSTSDGRSVEWSTTGPQNIVDPPEPLYEENAALSKGVIKQVDWEAEGADITVSRIVWRDGAQIHIDSITTHYLPWRAVYQYGPGTDIPTPEPTEEP